MNHTPNAILILIISLSLVIPLSKAAPNEQKAKVDQKGVEIYDKKPPTEAVPGQQPKPVSSKTGAMKTATAVKIAVYKPPLRGAPVGRIAGGTRGILDESPSLLCVLSPDHTGLTVQEQPSFYWFLSELATCPIEFTLIEEQGVRPLLETPIDPPEQPGVQCIRLAHYGVSLQQGMEYKWFVALVPDRDRRSKDILAWGAIERIGFSEALHAELAGAADEKAPHIYAEAGVWYDALAAISDMIDASPNDAVLRKHRASLLEQVGLTEIAQYETKHSISDGQ